MRCEEIRETIVAFVLGELSGAESNEVADHISTCEKCRTEAARYSKTLLALRRWELPPHSAPPVFAPSAQPAWSAGKSRAKKLGFWKVLDYGIRTALIAGIAAAFIFGTRIQYKDGGLTINIGNVGVTPVSMDSSRVASLVASAQRQNTELTSQMIEASEARQAELYRSGLTSLSREINNQQREYITYFMTHLYRLQQQDQLAYYQSRAALDGMVRLANAVK